ncbi:hypothetical protein B296_00000732 [Ensete ventricosum]|uniref:Uncharacterized protein n=1 Tax=Ensete ventricosum TaxID=4639 RepID=A0A427BC53_ENSVE|nr:hypothetical protein B296_00000732 [Ensete ventricosum]
MFNIWGHFHFLDVLAADRKPPGVGRGRGRGRDDTSGRPAKGIGRGQDDGSSKGGGRGRGGAGGKGGGVREYVRDQRTSNAVAPSPTTISDKKTSVQPSLPDLGVFLRAGEERKKGRRYHCAVSNNYRFCLVFQPMLKLFPPTATSSSTATAS